MLSVLDGGCDTVEASPVGRDQSEMLPVNDSTLSAVGEGRREGGLQQKGGNIDAVPKKIIEHAEGKVANAAGEKFKCFWDHGVSDDGKEYLNFESEWIFKTTPPGRAGLEYWVKQKLFRLVILYCPKDVESVRVETTLGEMFRLHGSSTDRENPDRHIEPRPYKENCNPLEKKDWCQMSCFELGILTLMSSDDLAYPKDYAETEETTSWSSTDKGKSWGPPEGHGSPKRSPPNNLTKVPGFVGYYIASYFQEHCPPPAPGSVQVQDTPTGANVRVPGTPTGSGRGVPTPSGSPVSAVASTGRVGPSLAHVPTTGMRSLNRPNEETDPRRR